MDIFFFRMKIYRLKNKYQLLFKVEFIFKELIVINWFLEVNLSIFLYQKFINYIDDDFYLFNNNL